VPLVYHHYLFTEDSANVSWTRILSPALVNEVNTGFRGLKELGNAKSPDEFKNFYRSTYGITLSQFNPKNNLQGFLPEAFFDGIPSSPAFNLDARTPIDCGDEVRQCHVAAACDLLERLPKSIFEADAGLVTGNDD
jgi:hypothetical protein